VAPRSGCSFLSLVYSLFAYVTRIRKIIAALLIVVLLSNPVAAGANTYVVWAGQSLQLNAGDRLYTYV